MEYQKDGDTAWTAVRENKTEITGLTAGTYKVRYAGTAGKNASPETSVEVGVKANATVTKAPEAKNLTYTGSAQELVTAGKATGGTMYYAVTTENTAPTNDNLYTTSIPAKTDAGSYYVWYKAKGDENQKDSEAKAVSVTIAPEPEKEPEPTPEPGKVSYDDLSDKEKKNADAVASEQGVDKDTAAAMVKTEKDLGVSMDTVKLSSGALAKMDVDSSDPKGTNFRRLTARVSKRGKKALTLKWTKQKKADGYLIYLSFRKNQNYTNDKHL